MMPHSLSKGCETEQSPTHKMPWVFQIKTQKSKIWAVSHLVFNGFQSHVPKESKHQNYLQLESHMAAFSQCYSLLQGAEEHYRGWGGDQLKEGDGPLPVWRTSTLDHRRNLTQKHEALRRRMKANTTWPGECTWSTGEGPEKISGAGERSGT